ncbi:hypothetical protein PRLR6025_06590 [Prevotella lacticifex]|nr:hypothetical protein PRLR6025_06590 [Prevotella lacticifex]
MFGNGVKIFRYWFVVELSFPNYKGDSENPMLLINLFAQGIRRESFNLRVVQKILGYIFLG